MVNLSKQQNNRKPISLIKPENYKRTPNNSNNIKCELLSSEFEPRTAHPVYTRQQYEALNKQRVKYKDPEKFDVLPGPAPQNLNCPAVPPNQQPAKKLYVDTDALLEMARIHNKQINGNTTDNNYSLFKTILIALVVILLIVLLFTPFSFTFLPAIVLLAYYVLAKYGNQK